MHRSVVDKKPSGLPRPYGDDDNNDDNDNDNDAVRAVNTQ
jgi:hypothetical protein